MILHKMNIVFEGEITVKRPSHMLNLLRLNTRRHIKFKKLERLENTQLTIRWGTNSYPWQDIDLEGARQM